MSPRGLHSKIVYEILPNVAERLKKEGLISSYDRKSFIIQPAKEWAPLTVKPDLVLHLSDKRKVLVEIANPGDPKRFMGELVYPYILGYHHEIDAAMVFVLQRYPREDLVHERGFTEKMLLDEILIHEIRIIGASLYDHKTEDFIYGTLKHFLGRKELLFSIGFPLS